MGGGGGWIHMIIHRPFLVALLICHPYPTSFHVLHVAVTSTRKIKSTEVLNPQRSDILIRIRREGLFTPTN